MLLSTAARQGDCLFSDVRNISDNQRIWLLAALDAMSQGNHILSRLTAQAVSMEQEWKERATSCLPSLGAMCPFEFTSWVCWTGEQS
jgi:hypothetical protein